MIVQLVLSPFNYISYRMTNAPGFGDLLPCDHQEISGRCGHQIELWSKSPVPCELGTSIHRLFLTIHVTILVGPIIWR
jgi:hypothetical protein